MDMTLFCHNYTLVVDFKAFLSYVPTFRVTYIFKKNCSNFVSMQHLKIFVCIMLKNLNSVIMGPHSKSFM